MNPLSSPRRLLACSLLIAVPPLAAQTPYPCSWAGGNGGDWLSFAWAPQPLDYIDEAGFPIPFPTWPDNDRAAGSGTFTYLVAVPNGRVNLGSGSITVATLAVSSGAETRLRSATLRVEGYAGFGGSAISNEGLISLGDDATLTASSLGFLPSGFTINGGGTVSLLDEESSVEGSVLDFGGSQLVRGAGKVGGAAGIGGVIPSTVINRGTFLADAPPLAMTVQGAAFENRGTARALGGGFLKLRSLLTDNRSLIESEGGVMDFQDDDVDNSGTLRARSGGILQFKDQDVDNGGGLIEATDLNSLVQLRGGVTLDGGTLRRSAPAQVQLQQGTNTFTGNLLVQGQVEVLGTAGLRLQNLTLIGEAGTVLNPQPGAVIYSTGAVDLRGRLDGNGLWSFNTPLSLTGPLALNNVQFDVGDAQPVNLVGTTTNNSILRLLDGPGTNDTRLIVSNGGTLSGTGRLAFTNANSNRVLPAASGAVFTNAAPHLLTTEPGGVGVFAATFVNASTTEAAGAGSLLRFENPGITNTGLLQARDGGVLRFNSLTNSPTANYVFANAGGTLRVGAGSLAQFEQNVLLRGGTVDGPGTLNTTGTTIFDSLPANPITITDSTVVLNEFQPFTVRGNLTNSGTLRLNDGTLVPNGIQGSASLTLDGDLTLGGNGRVLFDTPYTNTIAALGGTTPTLTTGSAQTVTNSPGARGLVYPATVNGGLIEAVGPHPSPGVPNIDLLMPALTNTGVIGARAGGFLRFEANALTIQNTGGFLRVENGATFQFAASPTVRGGTLDGTGTFSVNNLTLDGAANAVTNAATLALGAYSGLTLRGSILNTGTIRLATNVVPGASAVIISGPVTLGGSGRVQFASNLNNHIRDVPGTSPVLTNAAGHTLSTTPGSTGSITNASLINQGTIEARGSGASMNFSPGVLTNQGVIQSADAGFMNFNVLTTANAGGFLRAASGSTFSLAGGSVVNGGTLDGTGAFSIAQVTLDGTAAPVTVATQLSITPGTLFLRGAITNNGLISIATPVISSANVRIQSGGAVVGGTGAIRFGTALNNILTSPSNGATVPFRLLPGALVTTSPGAQGNINGLAFTNEGTVESRGSGASLTVGNNATNTGVFAAAEGGSLALNGSNAAFAIENNGGILRAEAGSSLSLDYGIEIRGGRLDGAGTVFSATGRLNGTVSPVTVATTLRTIGGGLTLRGSIVNNGNLLTQHTGQTSVRVDGPVTLSGNGAITFGGTVFSFWQGVVAADALTLGTGQTMTTTPGAQGRVQSLAVATAGIIEARGAGAVLDLWAVRGVTNTGVIRAANGGQLNLGADVSTYFINNAGGIIRNESGGLLLAATVRGGRIEGPGGIGFTQAALDGTANAVELAPDAVLATNGGTVTIRGTITNNGRIRLLRTASLARVMAAESLTLGGAGEIEFGTNAADSANILGQSVGGVAVTNGSAHTLRVTPGSTGALQTTSIVNAGRIVADGVLYLQTSTFTNGPTGVIRGNNAIVTTPVLANQGTIAPGTSPGALSIFGNVTNAATAVFEAEIGGTVSGTQFDRLSVSGSFARGGALRPVLVNGFRPQPTDSFLVLSATSLTGAWANVTAGKVTFEHGTFDVIQTATTVTLTNFTKNAAYTAYDTWMDGFPSLTGASREPGADADGDGLTNLLEFAFGHDPAMAGGSLTLRGFIHPGSGRYCVEFPRRKQPPGAPVLIYDLQFSSDLVAWTTHTASRFALIDINPEFELVTFEDTLTPPANRRRVARLLIRLAL